MLWSRCPPSDACSPVRTSLPGRYRLRTRPMPIWPARSRNAPPGNALRENASMTVPKAKGPIPAVIDNAVVTSPTASPVRPRGATSLAIPLQIVATAREACRNSCAVNSNAGRRPGIAASDAAKMADSIATDITFFFGQIAHPHRDQTLPDYLREPAHSLQNSSLVLGELVHKLRIQAQGDEKAELRGVEHQQHGDHNPQDRGQLRGGFVVAHQAKVLHGVDVGEPQGSLPSNLAR
mmetsp:Transcript_20851/g.52956  ORF Transcript_20851/g.52956 Transcript_20851/m.52956 type:complete len:236 (-) Transcript_20851:636-1343(-)